MRIASVYRETKETQIGMKLDLDGKGELSFSDGGSGIGFFDHMLNAFARHGLFDLEVRAKGDLEVDGHHLVEDAGIVLGEAVRQAAGDKAGIRRFGSFFVPMDEALVLCAIDLSGRPYFVMEGYDFRSPSVGTFDTQLVKEFFYSVSYSAAMNLHFRILSGENDHHVIEAMFKAFGRALDMATQKDPRITGIPSTKGSL